jgi:Domain of unknown function (DUF4062)
VLRIYISSTYKDLKDERAAVREAILECDHLPVGMESDVASEQRPIDVCLERLRGCQLYIGIIAWRYGFIEPRFGKSMTELEYEAAGEAGIDRLMFLASSGVSWNVDWVERTPELVRFRQRVEQDQYRREFASPDELAKEVMAAIRAFENRRENAPDRGRQVPASSFPPEKLICLVNRSDQDDALIRAAQKPTNRPQVFVLHGDDNERLEDYLERVQERTFGKWLGPVQHFPFSWPEHVRDPDDFHERLTLHIAERITAVLGLNTEELNHELSRMGRTIMLSTVLLSCQDIGLHYRDIFAYFSAYWNRWPALRPGNRLFVFLCVKYELQVPQRGWLPWLRQNRAIGRINAEIQRYLEALTHDTSFGLNVTPKLNRIRRTHCEYWLTTPEAKRAIQDHFRVQKLIRDFFAELERAGNEPSVPMEEMIMTIKRWLPA